MVGVSYRGFVRGDADALVELVAAAIPADAVTSEWFTENVLLDPNFDRDGLIVAVAGDGSPVGFVYAVRGRGTAGIPVDPAGGWITIGAVHPQVRRQGIGSELLARAMAFLRDSGAEWVNYAGYPPAYFLPGLDAELYPDGLRLLERHGFQTLYQPVAMDLNLSSYRTPEAVLKLRALREEDGYSFAVARPDDLPEVISFAARELAPDWGEAIREAVVRFQRPERVFSARDPEGRVVGFAIYGAYRGIPERFGPFGVAESQRGKGLGKIILHATLAQMRAEGAHTAWFLWTGLESPAGRLYRDSGFTVTRTFHVLQADLSPR